jgi:hypothetical protein
MIMNGRNGGRRRYYASTRLERLMKTTKTKRIVGKPAEIRNGESPTTNVKQHKPAL